MLGKKIRALRLQMGLSQQQLAGEEMSRAFISLVEAGKCTPSRQNLELIAARLGRPVEYFLGSHQSDDLEAAIALLESVERDLNQGTEALPKAQQKLRHLFKLLEGLPRPDLQAQAHFLWAQYLTRTRQDEEAMATCAQARAHYRAIQDAQGVAQTYKLEALAALRLQDYPRAQEAYEQALLYAGGRKRLQGFRVEVRKYLGSTHMRLGNYPEAAAQYERAWQEAEVLGDRTQKAEIAMGLGAALHRIGDLQRALDWTEQAVALFRELDSPDAVLAEHNLGNLQGALGRWETAYTYLKKALATYEARGWTGKQASALEDIAQYWLHRGDSCRARSACWSAIALLEREDDGVLRGRLYRHLGTVAAREERWEEARAMFHLSYEILRLLKAHREAAVSREALEAVRQRGSQMEEC